MASDPHLTQHLLDVVGEESIHCNPAGVESSVDCIPSQQQIHSDTSPPPSHGFSSSTASDSALSRQSRDTFDTTQSTSTVGSSVTSLSSQPKKKRYAKQHEAHWLQEGQATNSILKPGSTVEQPLPTLPQAQPQTQTPSSLVSTVSPALSILDSRKYARISPGHDAPAIQPGAPSAYLATAPLAHALPQAQEKVSKLPDGEALSAIDEEQTMSTRSRSPSSSRPEIEPSKLRRGLSKLLRRNK